MKYMHDGTIATLSNSEFAKYFPHLLFFNTINGNESWERKLSFIYRDVSVMVFEDSSLAACVSDVCPVRGTGGFFNPTRWELSLNQEIIKNLFYIKFFTSEYRQCLKSKENMCISNDCKYLCFQIISTLYHELRHWEQAVRVLAYLSFTCDERINIIKSESMVPVDILRIIESHALELCPSGAFLWAKTIADSVYHNGRLNIFNISGSRYEYSPQEVDARVCEKKVLLNSLLDFGIYNDEPWLPDCRLDNNIILPDLRFVYNQTIGTWTDNPMRLRKFSYIQNEIPDQEGFSYNDPGEIWTINPLMLMRK